MPGRHEAPMSLLEDIVADYAAQRARALVAQFDRWQSLHGGPATVLDWSEWIGSAAEILRELTRDA